MNTTNSVLIGDCQKRGPVRQQAKRFFKKLWLKCKTQKIDDPLAAEHTRQIRDEQTQKYFLYKFI